MIVRVFRGIVHDGKQDEFEKFFLETALPILEKQEGLVDVSIGMPHPLSPNEFLMVTTWRDLEALEGFTGPDWKQPVIHPEEAHLLREVFLHHYMGVPK